MNSKYYSFITKIGPVKINLDNLIAVSVHVNQSNKEEYEMTFHFNTENQKTLSFTTPKDNYDALKRCIDEIINVCNENEIDIFVRRNKEDAKKPDKHIVIFFAKYNLYISTDLKKIEAINNAYWNIRDIDTIDYYFHENDEDDTNDEEIEIEFNSLKEVYSKIKEEFEFMRAKADETEKRYTELVLSILKNNNQSTEGIAIPENHEISKILMNENRKSFLYRSKT